MPQPLTVEARSIETAQAVVRVLAAADLEPAFYPAVLRLAKQLLTINQIRRARDKKGRKGVRYW